MISRSSPFRRVAGLVGAVVIAAACTSSGASTAPSASSAASQAAPSTAASEAASASSGASASTAASAAAVSAGNYKIGYSNGGGVGNANPNHLSLLCCIGRGDGGGSAIHMLACRAVPHRNLVPRRDQARCHRTSHDAQTEEGDFHALLLTFWNSTRLEKLARIPETNDLS